MSGSPNPNLEPTPRPTPRVRLGDFMSEEMLGQAFDIGPDVTRLQKEVIEPNMAEINRKLGQENDPTYIAYMLTFALELDLGLPIRGSRWVGPKGLEVEVVWVRGNLICLTLVNAPLAQHDWSTGEKILLFEDWKLMDLKRKS